MVNRVDDWDEELRYVTGRATEEELHPARLAARAINEFAQTLIEFRKRNPDLFDANGFLKGGDDKLTT